MNHIPEIIHFTNRRATLAIGVAILADLIQLPINLSFFAAAASGVGLIAADVPLEALDAAIDIACHSFHRQQPVRFPLDTPPHVRAGNGARRGRSPDLDRLRRVRCVAS